MSFSSCFITSRSLAADRLCPLMPTHTEPFLATTLLCAFRKSRISILDFGIRNSRCLTRLLNFLQRSREPHSSKPYLDVQRCATRKAISVTRIHRKPILSRWNTALTCRTHQQPRGAVAFFDSDSIESAVLRSVQTWHGCPASCLAA